MTSTTACATSRLARSPDPEARSHPCERASQCQARHPRCWLPRWLPRATTRSSATLADACQSSAASRYATHREVDDADPPVDVGRHLRVSPAFTLAAMAAPLSRDVLSGDPAKNHPPGFKVLQIGRFEVYLECLVLLCDGRPDRHPAKDRSQRQVGQVPDELSAIPGGPRQLDGFPGLGSRGLDAILLGNQAGDIGHPAQGGGDVAFSACQRDAGPQERKRLVPPVDHAQRRALGHERLGNGRAQLAGLCDHQRIVGGPNGPVGLEVAVVGASQLGKHVRPGLGRRVVR